VVAHGGRGPGVRRRRGLASLAAWISGTVRAVVEADTPRVTCREHGVVVAAARHGAAPRSPERPRRTKVETPSPSPRPSELKRGGRPQTATPDVGFACPGLITFAPPRRARPSKSPGSASSPTELS